MRYFVWIAFILALAPVAHAQNPRPDLDVYVDCLADRAAELDDGMSDASVIGRAIAPLCREELRRSVAAMDVRRRLRDRAYAERLAVEAEAATIIVLRLRRARADLVEPEGD